MSSLSSEPVPVRRLHRSLARTCVLGLLCVVLPAVSLAGAQPTAPRTGAGQPGSQTAVTGSALSVSGHPGQIPMVQVNGRSYIDVEALARVTDSTLAFRSGQVILTLPMDKPSSDTTTAVAKPKRGFSQGFLNAEIEEMSVIREWRSALVTAVQNGYPINDDWVSQYRRTADNRLALASTAATTDSDRQAYPLLATEFANMQKQSDRFLSMRKNLEFIATYSLDQDPLDQQILSCSRGLSGLVASGQFEDVPTCH